MGQGASRPDQTGPECHPKRSGPITRQCNAVFKLPRQLPYMQVRAGHCHLTLKEQCWNLRLLNEPMRFLLRYRSMNARILWDHMAILNCDALLGCRQRRMSAPDSNDWNRNREPGSISRAVRTELSQTEAQETDTTHQSVVSPYVPCQMKKI